MELEKIFGGILLVAVLGCGFYVYRAGYFSSPTAEFRSYPEMHLLFKEHTGPLEGLAKVRQQARDFAKAHGITCLAGFEEIMTNPYSVDKSQMKAESGCLVASELANADANKTLSAAGWKYRKVETQNALVVTFHGSHRIGAKKMINAVHQYRVRNHKQVRRSIRLHYGGESLWTLPVQVHVYTLIDENAKIEPPVAKAAPRLPPGPQDPAAKAPAVPANPPPAVSKPQPAPPPQAK